MPVVAIIYKIKSSRANTIIYSRVCYLTLTIDTIVKMVRKQGNQRIIE